MGNNQKIISKIDAVKHLKEIIEVNSVTKIFLVTGKRSYEASGAKDSLKRVFSNAIFDRFTDFHVNPQLDDIVRGVEQYNRKSYDLVIAVGGGSAIDVAKSIRFIAYQTEDFLSILEGAPSNEPEGQPPLLVIPTTAGSGSEATHFSVVYHGYQKYSLAHQRMLPDLVCLDGVLTQTLTKNIAAYTGMDALCQAVEAFWSVNSTEESRQYSRQAIKLVMNFIIDSVENNTVVSRMKMLEASHLAGKAINITKTTGPHAFSYYLSTHFGIPHGQAVSLLIDSFLLFNVEVTDEDISDDRGIEYMKELFNELFSLLNADSAEQAAKVLKKLRSELSLEIQISSLLTSNGQIDDFFKSVNLQRLKNNPRLITDNNIGELKKLIFSA